MGGGAPTPLLEAGAPPIDYQAEARDIVGLARMGLVITWPSLEEVYTDDKCERLAQALAPVLEKYAFDLGRFGPELGLAVVAIPLAAQTYAAIRAERAAKKPDQAAAPRGAQAPVIDQTDPASLHTKV